MARAYSDDLRKKLLEAHDAGKGTLAELAERFGVSRGWAWKISSARARTGATTRPPYRPGRKARVDRQVIEQLLEAQPELLLRELGGESSPTGPGFRFVCRTCGGSCEAWDFVSKKIDPRP